MSYRDVVSRWVHAPADEDWKDWASCKGTDPDMWFPAGEGRRHYDPEVQAHTRRAKLICKECPVQRDCLEWAITVDERFGIYGGLTERERELLTGRRPE
jgi:WhiB family transcriptional regulator, redox-sensing transcriptional regulator